MTGNVSDSQMLQISEQSVTTGMAFVPLKKTHKEFVVTLFDRGLQFSYLLLKGYKKKREKKVWKG